MFDIFGSDVRIENSKNLIRILNTCYKYVSIGICRSKPAWNNLEGFKT